MLNQDIVNNVLQGEENAIITVLNHYSRYIKKLCLTHVGGGKYEVDEDMEAEVTEHLWFALMGLGGKE